jgi:hypothetical protein
VHNDNTAAGSNIYNNTDRTGIITTTPSVTLSSISTTLCDTTP